MRGGGTGNEGGDREMKGEVREGMREEVREGMREEVREGMREEVRKGMKGEVEEKQDWEMARLASPRLASPPVAAATNSAWHNFGHKPGSMAISIPLSRDTCGKNPAAVTCPGF
ncbi:hypothetical protein Pmani_037229 [Petrolisthes manimaculis]|uniref:Uncharacterized protein n=1 Tax=Petrolisthes manimaculis TaxID=1843537 RepID=A0AAE1NIV7_9EUCA|nr:hypothetical protein Pmani_037229 [Petrolisthes manimaculis]